MDHEHRHETLSTWPWAPPFRAPVPIRPSTALDRQLTLPLPSVAPLDPAPRRPPPTPVEVVRPRQVWRGVPPAARTRVRQAAERILEEVVRDGLRDGPDRA
jgi:hypothetical protein